MKSKVHARGFSLLEAVVALAILAAAGMALFAAMTQSVQMVGRAERARDADLALRNSLAWVELVNPMDEPTGERDVGAYLLRWRAEPLEAPRDGTTGYLQPGLYQVGLYRMTLELWRDGTLERQVELNRAGYRQVRKPQAL